VEEAFVTWCDVEVAGATALVKGQRHTLKLTIEQPQAAAFAVEMLEEQSRANDKPGVLTRITASVPPQGGSASVPPQGGFASVPAALETVFRMRMEVL
jgi:hypothetical protein